MENVVTKNEITYDNICESMRLLESLRTADIIKIALITRILVDSTKQNIFWELVFE